MDCQIELHFANWLQRRYKSFFINLKECGIVNLCDFWGR